MADLWLNLPTFGSTAQTGTMDFGLPTLKPGDWKEPEPPKRNLLAAGLSAGFDQLQALGGRAAEAVGRATGVGPLERWGAGVAESNWAQAEKNGRPDLETPFWREGGPEGIGGAASYLAYQVLKQVPTIGATLGAAAATAPLLPTTGMLGAALGSGGLAARGVAALPGFLGGQGLRAGATAAEAELARQAAAQTVRFGAGAAVTSYPMAVGSLYDQAKDREAAGGEPASRAEAFGALAAGVPYAALEAVEPTALRSIFKGGAAELAKAPLKNAAARVAERVVKGAAAGAAAEAPTEAAQTAMEQYLFGGNESPGEKARAVVDAFLIGGAIGGVFGGGAGMLRRAQSAQPAQLSNEDLSATIDGVVSGPQLDLFPNAPTQRGPAAPGQGNLFGDLPDQVGPDPRQLDLFAPKSAPPPQLDLFGNPSNAEPPVVRPEQQLGLGLEGLPPESSSGFVPPWRQFFAQSQQPEDLFGWASREPRPPMQPDFFQPTLTEPRGPEAPPAAAQRAPADPAQGDLLSWQAPPPPAPAPPVLDRVLEGSDVKLRKQDRAFFDAEDEVGIAEKVLTVLERQKDNAQSRAAAGIAERLGIDRSREQLAARGMEAIQELRNTRDDAQANALRAEIGRINNGINLLDAVAERRRGNTAVTNSAITESAAAPVSNEIPNTAMGAALTPVRRQREFEAARAQQAQQQRAAGPASTEAVMVLPDLTPEDSPNLTSRTSANKTVRAFNSLTAEQQQAVLAREEFGGDPQALFNVIATFPEAQPTVRRYIEQAAGVEPGTFDKPYPVRKPNALQTRARANQLQRINSASQLRQIDDQARAELRDLREVARDPAQGLSDKDVQGRLEKIGADFLQRRGGIPPIVGQKVEGAPAQAGQPAPRDAWTQIRRTPTPRPSLETTMDALRTRLADQRAQQIEQLRNMGPRVSAIDADLGREINALIDVAGRGDPRVSKRQGLTNEALAQRMDDLGRRIIEAAKAKQQPGGPTKADVQYSVRQGKTAGVKAPALVKAQDAAIAAIDRGDPKAAAAALKKAGVELEKQSISGRRPAADRVTETQIEAQRMERIRQAALKAKAENEGKPRGERPDQAARRQKAEDVRLGAEARRARLRNEVKTAYEAAKGEQKAALKSLLNRFNFPNATTDALQAHFASLSIRGDDGGYGEAMQNYRTPDNAGGMFVPGWYQQVSDAVNALAARLGMPYVSVNIADPLPERPGVRGIADDIRNLIGLRADLTPSEAMAVAMHELGHLVEARFFLSAPANVRDAILAAYERSAKARTIAQSKPLTSRGRPDVNQQLSNEYQLSFDEWFAEQVSRWLTTQQEPVGIVEKFFAGIGRIWKAIYEAVRGHIPLDVSVKEFMDGVWRGEIGPQTDVVVAGRVRADIDGEPIGLNNRAAQVSQNANSFWEKFKQGRIREAFMDGHLYMTTVGHISQFYKGLFGEGKLEAVPRAQEFRTAAEARLSDLAMKPMLSFEKLQRLSERGAKQVQELMNYTGWYIDPRKGWDGHKHLHDEANKAELRQKVAEANKLWADAGRVKLKDDAGVEVSAQGVYNDLSAVNEAMYSAQHAVELHNLINTNPNWAKAIKKAGFDPMEAFMEQSALHESPTEAAKFWRKWLDTLAAQAGAFVKEQTKDQKGGSAKSKDVELLKDKLNEIGASMQSIERAPYFHLGRQGRYFVEFKIRPDAKNKNRPDVAAQAAVEKALIEAGIDGVEIPVGSENPGVFMRFETLAQAQHARNVAEELNKKGLLAQRKGSPITSGEREVDDTLTRNTALISKLVQHFQSQLGLLEDEKLAGEEGKKLRADQMKFVNQLRQYAINMMPDTSNSKVMTHRKFVGGYSKDMMWSYANRARLAAHAVANMSSSARMIDAMVGLQQDIRAAKGQKNLSKTVQMQRILEELSTREANRADGQQNLVVDSIRAWNHAYFLGLSPSYFLVQLTQLPVMLVPELAKRTSFLNASRSVARNTGTATKIMTEIFNEAKRSGGQQKVLGINLNTRLPDVNVTEAVLMRALQNDPQKEEKAAFIMAMVNRGKIDLGSASREIGRIVDGKAGSTQDLMLRYASSFGLYSETLTRIAAALSARDVAIKNGLSGRALQDYAVGVIDQSMFNYQSDNVARAFGRRGLAGPATPIATAFLQYSFQLMEKMYREFHTMTKDQSPANRAAARRFIGGHLAAVTMLAGTLGLPMVTVAARAIEALKDVLDDDDKPYDLKAEWRNFLNDVFGKDVGEIIARGVPRAVGIDISQRVGEADILPFSKLIADRRTWQDALKDMAFRTAGAPSSMMMNILEGGSQFANGNLLEGMKTAMPSALRGPIEAVRIGQNGFTDQKGNRIPVDVDAWTQVVQALGFQPAGKAEYQEEKFGVTVSKGVLVRDASNIRKNLASAIERGNMDDAREWLSRAQQWDRNNPAYAILPGLPGVLQQRASERTKAQVTGTPLGTNIRDLVAQQTYNFGNY